MIKAEKAILGRTNDELTSYAGYAGAKQQPSDGKLCYHNMRGISDYNKAGAGEVWRSCVLDSDPLKCASSTFRRKSGAFILVALR